MYMYDLKGRHGFDVIHNSGNWRLAVHAYDGAVNGLEGFKSWGIHEDSEEGFVLLKGAAWLIICESASDHGFQVFSLKLEQIYLVQPRERHAIILDEDSEVLIIENRDMSRTYSEALSEGVTDAVKGKIGGRYGRNI